MKEDSARSIDSYNISKTIHESAEGVIYKAVNTASGSKVLIKLYYPTLTWPDEVLSEFFNLVGYLRFIEHEYLLPVLDVGKYENLPYVVFEDRSEFLLINKPEGQVSDDEALNFSKHVAEALDFLHKQEILHGTINPSNIIVDIDGFPQVFDYGLSGVFKKLLIENTDDGFDNLSIANLKSTSPEQIQGRTPTRSSDLYSFGAIFYYFIFREYPFDGQHLPELAASQIIPGIVRTVELPNEISKKTFQVIQKCLQLDPKSRFESFTQLVDILNRILDGRQPRISYTKRFATKRGASTFSTRWIYLGGVMLFVAIASFYIYSQRSLPLSLEPTSTISPLPNPIETLPATKSHTQPTSDASSSSPTLMAPTTAPTQATVDAGDYKPAFENEQPRLPSEVITTINLTNLHEISRLGYGKPEDVAISANNDIAVATSAGVFIFRGSQLTRWLDSQGWATAVQFSKDNKLLAVGLKSGVIQVWDWQNENRIAVLSQHTGQVNRILFTEDKMYSASTDRSIILWNLKTLSPIGDPIQAHSTGVNDIAVTRDGRILISCADDQLIRVWDLASRKKLYELTSKNAKDFTGNIRAVAISSNDAFFAAGGDTGYLYQWKDWLPSSANSNPKPLLRNDVAPVGKKIWSVAYIRPDADLNDANLLLGLDGGESSIYVANRQKYEGISLSFSISSSPSSLADVFGPGFDFKSVSTFGNEITVSINWDGSVISDQSQLIAPMYDNLDRLDFSPNGEILAAGGRRGSTNVWDLKDNQPLYKNLYFMPFGDPIAPDGSAIAILIGDSYQMKQLTGSQTAQDLSGAPKGGIVSYTSNGSVFVSSNLTQSKTWDFASGYETLYNRFTYLGCQITVSANDNKDLQVVSASGILPFRDSRADLLCPKSEKVKGNLSAFSKTLNLLVYVNQNGLLEGFDIGANKTIWTSRLNNSGNTTALAVSPDGSIVVVGDSFGRMTFFEGATGDQIAQTVGNFGSLHAIIFSDDGKKIATTGEDGIARTFGVVNNP